MWDRTVTVGSAGSALTSSHSSFGVSPFSEAFAATGWRVGWVIGPESIIKPTLAASTRIVFCSNAPLQEAAAAGLEQAEKHNFFSTQLNQYAERRKILTDAFDKLGMKYTLPEGSYFVLLVCTHRFTCRIETNFVQGYFQRQFSRRLPIPAEHSWQGT
jgi:kynurenine aminotransferase